MSKTKEAKLRANLKLLSDMEAHIKKPRVPRAPAGLVFINKEILRSAEKRNSAHCAIAHALAVKYPWATSVSVDLQTIRFSNPDKKLRYVYLTPRIAQEYVVSFDQGEHSDAFSFKLSHGHVMSMYTKSPQEKKGQKEYYENVRKNSKTYKAGEKLKRQRAVLLQRNKGSVSVPEVIGGREPPIALNHRREYGLRAMRR
jgi:hypothetical protein